MRYLIVLAALAGCASTPSEVMDQGERTDYTSKRAPLDAAQCIERNASEIKWGIVGSSFGAQTRGGREHGTYEVIYNPGPVIAVALTRPAGSGSSISIWRNPAPIGALRGEGTLEDQLVRGCQ